MFDALSQYPGLVAALGGMLGLLVGSFLNVVSLRLPRRMEHEWRAQCLELLDRQSPETTAPPDLLWDRSRCPHCGHAISALENIPVLSYLALRGRCSACGARISFQYPVVETLTGLVSGWLLWHFGATPQGLTALPFAWSLIALSVIDIREQLLPDSITLPLLWCGLFFNLWSVHATLADAVIGALAGYLFLWLVYHAFRLLTGKEGMGYGDFKLFGAIGAWLGWQLLPAALLFASLVGVLAGVGMIIFLGRDRQLPIPFGPYLAAAGFLAMLYGKQVTEWYLRFSGLSG